MDKCQDFDSVRKDYPWPASCLTKGDMVRLTELRERLGRPITKLLHKSVPAYYNLLAETSETTARCCKNPALGWSGTLENAAIV